MNALLKLLLLSIAVVFFTPASAQVMMSAEYASGENIARAKATLLPENTYTFSSEAYRFYRLSIYGWRPSYINFGAAAQLSHTAFTVDHTAANHRLKYEAEFLSVEPFLDASVDRKKIMHLQIGLPMNVLTSGKQRREELVRTNYRPVEDISSRDSFRKFIPQIAFRITATFPVIKWLRVTGSAGYIITLDRYVDMDDKHVHPVHIYLGLGIGFNTLGKHQPQRKIMME